MTTASCCVSPRFRVTPFSAWHPPIHGNTLGTLSVKPSRTRVPTTLDGTPPRISSPRIHDLVSDACDPREERFDDDLLNGGKSRSEYSLRAMGGCSWAGLPAGETAKSRWIGGYIRVSETSSFRFACSFRLGLGL